MGAAMPKLTATFDGSFDGFLCIVHAFYYEKIEPLFIQSDGDYQQSLETEEYYIATDFDKAMKVLLGIRRKISVQAEDYLTFAFLATDEGRFMDMFRYVVLGFKVGRAVDDYMQLDYVLGVHKRARYVGREAHLLSGFCRFSETQSGVFYCDISPVNDVLQVLAEHFSDRMIGQAWVIHDKGRNRAAVYDSQRYIICDVPKDVQVEYVDREGLIKDLWGTFFNSVTIKSRINKKLQQNHLPLRFRKYMTEFNLTTE